MGEPENSSSRPNPIGFEDETLRTLDIFTSVTIG